MKPIFVFLLAAGLVSPAWAALPGADLPPEAQAVLALEQHPMVQAARATIDIEKTQRTQLQAGAHEFNFNAGLAQRNINSSPDSRFSEWEVGVSRTFRLPGKVRSDSALGDARVKSAESAQGEAMHEAGRDLLRTWFVWEREFAQVAEWDKQTNLLQAQVDAVTKRIKGGDAARVERLAAEAALAQAEAQRAQTTQRMRSAANDLAARFPQVLMPVIPQLGEPEVIPHDAAYWRDEIMEHNHELFALRAEADRWRAEARRSEAGRTPDPELRLRFANERGGEEKVFGVGIALPLPGAARSAAARGALLQAEAMQAQVATTQARLQAEAANTYEAAAGAFASWQANHAAEDNLIRSAELIARAYQLGEGSLSEVLAARRLAQEARLAARQAQADAQETHYRLLLDSHQLWPLEAGHAAGEAGHASSGR
ncbi:MAG: TolC family protein [Thiobacillaceae bacterium]